jgi:hypothetical protein
MLPKMRKQSSARRWRHCAYEMKGMANVKCMPKVVPAPDDRHGFGHMDHVRA